MGNRGRHRSSTLDREKERKSRNHRLRQQLARDDRANQFRRSDILDGDNRAVILGSTASKMKRTGKIVKTDFAIVLTIANGKIVRFQMLENSFAVSQAARS